MQIIHLIPSIDEEASGPSYSVTKLNYYLSERVDSKLFTISKRENNKDNNVYKFKENLFMYKISISLKLILSLIKEVKKNKLIIIHNHSLWLPLNYIPYFYNLFFKCNYVISPRGTLSDWSLKNSKIKKFFIWRLIQKRVLKNAIAFHATSHIELEEIRKLGFKQPVAVIPNGIEPINDIKKKKKDIYSYSNDFSIIFLSRIHQKKGLENLINAWNEMKFPKNSKWKLKIFGTGNKKYINHLKEICLKKNIINVSFNGPVYGEKKILEYTKSDIFVLNSYSENFGQSVLESLNCGTPVIVSDQMPWGKVEINNCGWVVKNNTNAIVELFEKKIFKMTKKTLYEMSMNGIDLSKSDFNWKKISNNMINFYDWLNYGGDKPPFIHNND